MLLKHLRLLPSYFRFGVQINNEYKFQLYTNVIALLLELSIWLSFWWLLSSELSAIQHWTLPMLLLLAAFYQVHLSLWQMCYATLLISNLIVKGNIDNYLVRPIQPIFALVMNQFQIMSFIPLIVSIALIIGTVIWIGNLSIIKLTIAFLICIASVAIMQQLYIIFGMLSFWFGNVRPLIGIHRQFLLGNTFPIDVMPRILVFLLVFISPAAFMGTYPVLILYTLSTWQIIGVCALTLLLIILWNIIIMIIWRRGIAYYESYGG